MSHAVIFDLDGVLVDTVDAHFQGWSAVAAELGVGFSRADNEHLRGVSGHSSLDRLTAGGPPLDAAGRAALLKLKGRVYRRAVRRAGGAIGVPGVEGLLRDLRAMGVPVGVASASRHARMLMAFAGLRGLADVVSDGRFRGRPKPAPDQFLEVARRLGVAPERCVVVEDGLVGFEAARRAGMEIVGIGPVAEHTPFVGSCLDSLVGVTAESLLSLARRGRREGGERPAVPHPAVGA